MAGRSAVQDSMPTEQWMNHRNREVRGQPISGLEDISSYFGYVPELTAGEEADLRQQQAVHRQKLEEINRQNYWMLGPIFAPDLLLFGTEAAGAIAARAAAKRLAALPELKLGVQPRNGETIYTILGKRAHADLRVKIKAKPNWIADGRVPTSGGKYRVPDGQTPLRIGPMGERRFNLDLKPDTSAGRAEGARKKALYEDETRQKTRILHYDPKKYLR